MYAMASGKPKIFESLLAKKCNLNAQDVDGTTALMIAAATQGYEKIVELLLKYGADPTKKNKEGKTALDFAASSNKEIISQAMSPSKKTIKREQGPVYWGTGPHM
jgi:ankyrin repeat protein